MNTREEYEKHRIEIPKDGKDNTVRTTLRTPEYVVEALAAAYARAIAHNPNGTIYEHMREALDACDAIGHAMRQTYWSVKP